MSDDQQQTSESVIHRAAWALVGAVNRLEIELEALRREVRHLAHSEDGEPVLAGQLQAIREALEDGAQTRRRELALVAGLAREWRAVADELLGDEDDEDEEPEAPAPARETIAKQTMVIDLTPVLSALFSPPQA